MESFVSRSAGARPFFVKTGNRVCNRLSRLRAPVAPGLPVEQAVPLARAERAASTWTLALMTGFGFV